MEIGKLSSSEICINCLDCVHACPERLLPNYLFHFVSAGLAESLEKYGIDRCTECGLCDESCSARLPLLKAMNDGKKVLAALTATPQNSKE